MENDYGKSNDAVRDQQTERKRQAPERNGEKQTGIAPSRAAQLLQSGAKLRDLSPEELREMAAAVGNQTMIRLLQGGDAVPLAPAPPDRDAAAELPENTVEIRWPALCVPPTMARDRPLPDGVFSVEALRPMGRGPGNGVTADG